MAYTLEPHKPAYNEHVRRVVCTRCGLLYLNNSLTEWHIKMGCDADSHPDADKMCALLTKQWQERRKHV